MDSERSSFRVVMFPWLAHGHIFPYLELAKRIITKKNFHIHLCTTAINFTSVNQFINQNQLENSIEVAELHLQPTPELPPHYHTTKNLPSHLNVNLLKAFQTARSSFSDIITNLKPHLIIYDIFQPWAASLASSRGIPAVHFAPFGAAATSFSHHCYARGDEQFPFPELWLNDHERRSLNSLMEFLYFNVFDEDKDVSFVNYRMSHEVVLLKTSRGFEGKYLDYVSSVTSKRILAVGPLVIDVDDRTEMESSEIMQWLSKKEQNSTVYISFGSECFLSKEEIREIAKGVELSEANFIWIIRFPVMEKAMSMQDVLPQGFLDRVRGRGIVVSGWAPQANILGHPSTGAFVSHCGWSSLNESMYYGVPVVGMPMKLSMFIDAKMLVHAGACVEVVRDGNGEYDGDEIARAINEVIGGDGARRRARELSEKMRSEEDEAIEEAGECLWQICCKNESKD